MYVCIGGGGGGGGSMWREEEEVLHGRRRDHAVCADALQRISRELGSGGEKEKKVGTDCRFRNKKGEIKGQHAQVL